MIKIQNLTYVLPKYLDSMQTFLKLQASFSPERLFLLESLSGPEMDMGSVGYNPLFSLIIKDDVLFINGSNRVLSDLTEDFGYARSDARLDERYLIIPDEELIAFDIGSEDVFSVIRKIENQIKVEYEGITSNMSAGLFGYFTYDTIFKIEPKLKKRLQSDMPILHFSFYQLIISIDLKKSQTKISINESADFPSISLDLIKQSMVSEDLPLDDIDLSIRYKTKPTVSKSEYFEWFKRAKAHIEAGDVYQVQLGHSLRIKSDLKPFDVYRRLRKINPSSYMYYLNSGVDSKIIGASPEVFVNIDYDGEVVMRPIAGTIRRSDSLEENIKLVDSLHNDPKERAEHLMLVDLCRNDLAKVAISGSVETSELMIIEQYSHVFHLVSNVVAKKDDKYDKYDVIAATFPAGTMSGTPKVRAVEIIESIEKTCRGVYAGCVGYFGLDGYVQSALCIRTAIYHDGVYDIRASGGIVEDSTDLGEWEETISKLSSTYFAITGRELRDEDFID